MWPAIKFHWDLLIDSIWRSSREKFWGVSMKRSPGMLSSCWTLSIWKTRRDGLSRSILPSQMYLRLLKLRVRLKVEVVARASNWIGLPVIRASILLFAPLIRRMVLGLRDQVSIPYVRREQTAAMYKRIFRFREMWSESKMCLNLPQRSMALAIRASTSKHWRPSDAKSEPRYLNLKIFSNNEPSQKICGRFACCAVSFLTCTALSASVPLKFCDLALEWLFVLCIFTPVADLHGR